jgi:hypothetical protein
MSRSLVAATSARVDSVKVVERRGIVYISPTAVYLPISRMVDPLASVFSVSWQDWDDSAQRGEMIEDGGEVSSAETAISWGHKRSDRVLIRLGHTEETQFSAGPVRLEETHGNGRSLPLWPPKAPPSEGWWTPSDEAAARAAEIEGAHGSPREPDTDNS